MGASGAGKTTCLDVLAQRKNIGIVTGSMLVDGRPLASDFARGTAYAEQMDVHEGSATVREAMRFSAHLRQPASVSEEEKDAYVEEMIELLELQDLADALVITLGVEARKRLTIGVELASKPELLLFLDESVLFFALEKLHYSRIFSDLHPVSTGKVPGTWFASSASSQAKDKPSCVLFTSRPHCSSRVSIVSFYLSVAVRQCTSETSAMTLGSCGRTSPVMVPSAHPMSTRQR